MKKIIICTLLASTCGIALAVLMQPFSGWESLREISPDIVIARCTRTPPLFETNGSGIRIDREGGIVYADIDVELILKGDTKIRNLKVESAQLGRARLSSQYWPRQDECYAIFGLVDNGIYDATETYRIVPLGLNFPTNILSGKSLDEQIKTLLDYRRGQLKRQMGQDKEEMQRLDDGLRK